VSQRQEGDGVKMPRSTSPFVKVAIIERGLLALGSVTTTGSHQHDVAGEQHGKGAIPVMSVDSS
jgi:hypothetical protein